MSTEKFYRKPDGKIIFNAVASVGVNRSIDCSEIDRRTEEHFIAHEGWPKNRPTNTENTASIWSSFKGMGYGSHAKC